MAIVNKLMDLKMLLVLFQHLVAANIVSPDGQVVTFNIGGVSYSPTIYTQYKDALILDDFEGLPSFDLIFEDEKFNSFSLSTDSISLAFDSLYTLTSGDLTVTRVSVRKKNNLLTGKYLVSFQDKKYSCLVFPNGPLIISVCSFEKLYKSNAKKADSEIYIEGSIMETDYLGRDTVSALSLEQYLEILERKYIDYNKEYFMTSHSSDFDSKYSFEEQDNVKCHLVNDRGMDYLIYVNLDLFESLELQGRLRCSVAVLGDMYIDSEVAIPLIKVSTITIIE